MRVLCTGGAGFIGSHLVDRLIEAGHQVLVLDDLSGGTLSHVHREAEFVKCNLVNPADATFRVRRFKPELVFHLAANAAENKAQFSPIDITSRNWNTFINTLTAALQGGSLKRIVVTSSIAVYGAIKPPFLETDRPEPEDLYGLSKLMMEEALKILSRVHPFEYVITRPHNVYGPRQNMRDPYRNVVTIWMNQLLKGEPYVIYGDGSMRRCFSYVSDVVDALYQAGFVEGISGMTFNVGADEDYSLEELSAAVQAAAGPKFAQKPVYLPARPQEVAVAVSDHSQAREKLALATTVSLQEGIRRTWEYCQSQGYQEPIFTELELPSDLAPANWRKAA